MCVGGGGGGGLEIVPCQDWGHAGQQGGRRTGTSGRGALGHDNCDIHTHTRLLTMGG